MPFPKEHAELDQAMLLQELRPCLPLSTYFGSQSLYTASDAMILEINSSMGLPHFWPLCSQLLVLSPSRVLVLSGASGETWITVLDQLLAQDPGAAATCLRWKPSRGGRPVATPSATTAALAATRKKANRKPAALDLLTEVIIRGEVGQEDGEVMRLLMSHVATSTGIVMTEKTATQPLKHGEFEHVPVEQHGGTGGRVRVLLKDAQEVEKLRAALHGQHIAVGHTRVGIEVINERFDLDTGAGNGVRRRA